MSNIVPIEDLGMRYPNVNSNKKRRYGLYKCIECDCEFETQISTVKHKGYARCRLCSNKANSIRHGYSRTKLYQVYQSLKSRCTDINKINYKDYGGRGIKICDEWKNDFLIFRTWALENGYKEGLSIDRIDNDGNYEPINCRWVTKEIQTRNTRLIHKRNKSGYRGVSTNKQLNKWNCFIRVNNKSIYLGVYKCRLEEAYTYDNYVISNNLEHTTNFGRVA